jgi:hypothetical protein
LEEEWTEQEPVLSAASQRALTAFVEHANAALRVVDEIRAGNSQFDFGGDREIFSVLRDIAM